MFSECSKFKINSRAYPHDIHSFPLVKQPRLVGEYSLSPEGHFENSGARLRFLAKLAPSLCQFSLKPDDEAETVQQDSLRTIYLDNMFYFLASSKDRFQLQSDADIVCTREVLELIMCAPHEHKHNFTLAVSRYHNTVYMCLVPSDTNNRSLESFQEHLVKQIKANWLKNLRQHCLVAMGDNTVQPSVYHVKPENGQYYGVFSMDIDGTRLLFDAPVLAQHSSNPFIEAPKTFVELKLRLDTMNRAEWLDHQRNKGLKWWAECFLVGIENIYIAYHNGNAVVQKIRRTMVRELWEECKNEWSANLCANFLARFVNIIKKLMEPMDCPSTVYLFEYDARNGNFTYRTSEGRNEHTFIPDWFRILFDDNMDHLDANVELHN